MSPPAEWGGGGSGEWIVAHRRAPGVALVRVTVHRRGYVLPLGRVRVEALGGEGRRWLPVVEWELEHGLGGFGRRTLSGVGALRRRVEGTLRHMEATTPALVVHDERFPLRPTARGTYVPDFHPHRGLPPGDDP